MRKKIKVHLLISTIFLIAVIPTASNAVSNEPTFEQYIIDKQFEGRPAQVDLKSAPGASQFRTVLREGAKKGPNFAGHYTIVEWGCGSSCTSIAVVDATNGHIVFPNEISPLLFTGLPEGEQSEDQSELSYKKDSSLLIFKGIPSREDKPGSYYYQWKAGKFELIFSREWDTTDFQ